MSFLEAFSAALPKEISLEDLKIFAAPEKWQEAPEIAAILSLRRSGKFDTRDYLERYPDVRKEDADPIQHFINHGIYEKRHFKYLSDKNFKQSKEQIEIISDNTIATISKKKANIVPSDNIIISLTSYPARIKTVHLTIHSLINQTVKADKIILWLAKNEFEDIEKNLPVQLLELRENGLLQIGLYNNIKSHKKLIPTLLYYSDSIIVTADDDIIYSDNWLELLYTSYINDKNSIHAHRCHKIKDNNFSIYKYSTWDKCIQTSEPSFRNVPTTGGGVLYPPNAFNSEVVDIPKMMRLSEYADDIWFWAMSVLSNKKTRVVNDNIIKLNFIHNTQKETLYHDINLHGNNDVCINKILYYYPEIIKKINSERKISNIHNIKNSHNVKISIIIPIYNNSTYLEECIDSVLCQTLHDIEIICIDDGSTDIKTISILESYEKLDKRIKLIKKKNTGYGHSMNIGIDIARGEYIGIVESDDYILPDMYEQLYDIAIKNDVQVVKSDFESFYEHSNRKHFTYISISTNNGYNKVLCPRTNISLFHKTNALANWACIYKKDFLKKNKIRHNETPGAAYQDTGFWYQVMAHCNSMYILNKAFYKYRTDNTESSTLKKNMIDAIINEYKFIDLFFQKNRQLATYFIDIVSLKKFRSFVFNYSKLENKENYLQLIKNELLKNKIFPFRNTFFNHKEVELYDNIFSNKYRHQKIYFSVIIPVFNAQDYLRDCLDSLITQSCNHIEIICINDGSTDNSQEILDYYAKRDSRIRVINQKNAGAGAARNTGLAIARGKYLSFLDADDFFEQTLFEEAFDKCESNRLDIFMYGFDFFSQREKKIVPAPSPNFNIDVIQKEIFNINDIKKDIFRSFKWLTWNKIYSKKLITDNKIKFQELPTHNDIYFNIMAFIKAKRVSISKKIYVHYRDHQSQTRIRNSTDKNIDCCLRALSKIKDSLVSSKIYDLYKNDFINFAVQEILFIYKISHGNSCIKLSKIIQEQYKNDFSVDVIDTATCYDKTNFDQYKLFLNLY